MVAARGAGTRARRAGTPPGPCRSSAAEQVLRRSGVRREANVLIKASILVALACGASSLAWAQSHPNLNGIWQALNEANWDLEGHNARPSPVVAMGALAAAPG